MRAPARLPPLLGARGAGRPQTASGGRGAVLGVCLALAASAAAQPAAAPLPTRFEPVPTLRAPGQGTPPTISDVYADRDGFLWFASDAGLLRFDGVETRAFRAAPGGLPTDVLHSVTGDGADGMWVTAARSLVHFDPASGRARRLALGHTPAVTSPTYFGNLIAVDRAGWMLVVPDGRHVVRLAPGGRAPREMRLPGADTSLVITSRADRDGAAWVTSLSGGVWRVQLATGAVRRYARPDGRGMAEVRVSASGRPWLRTTSGLYRLDARGRFVRVLAPDRWPTGIPLDPLSRTGSGVLGSTFTVDKNETLWLVRDGDAVVSVDLATGRATTHRHVPDAPASVAVAPRAQIVGEDPAGGMWFGFYYDPRRVAPPSRAFRPLYSVAESGSTALRSAATRSGALLVAQYGGPLLRFPSPASESPDAPERLADGPLGTMALRETRDGRLWLPLFGSGEQGGLARRETDGRWRRFWAWSGRAGWLGASARAVLETSAGTVWVGTEDGLQRWRPATDDFARVGGPLATATVWCLAEADGGGLWVGTYGQGLWHYDPATGRQRVYAHRDAYAATIPSDLVVEARPSRLVPGRVWVSTYDGGAALLDPATGRARRLTAADGLPSNAARGVLEDGRGYAWLAVQGGLVRLHVRRWVAGEPGALRVFTEADGLPDTQFSMYGTASLPDGRFVLATLTNVVAFRPDEVDLQRGVAPVVVTRVTVEGRETALPAHPRGLRLGPRERDLSVEVAAPDVAAGPRTRYRYRLDGHDDGWTVAGTRRLAAYTNLRPGRYTFVAEADAGTGWGGRLSLPVEVAPAWWQRASVQGLAALLAALALLGAGVAVGRLRLQRQLAAAEAERAAERRVAAERERISRDLHDHVGGRLAAVIAEAEAARYEGDAAAALGAVEAGARATMAGLREAVWALHHDRLTAGALAARLRREAEAQARPRGVAVEVTVAGDAEQALGPDAALHLLRLGQEAVANALRHSGAAAVRVTVEAGADALALTVADDGQFRPPDGEGYGLRTMAARAEALGGTLRLATDAGTTVRVEVPAGGDAAGAGTPGLARDFPRTRG